MKAKWYFSTLIIILTFFGFTQGEKDLPNQEIVIQFTPDTVTSLDVENAITTVKNQLQSINITGIQVQELQEGKLRIAYYSTKDVSRVRKALSSTENVALEHPFSNHSENETPGTNPDSSSLYEVKVVELQNQSSPDSGLNGKLVLSQNQELDRLNVTNVYFAFANLNYSIQNNLINVAYKVSNNTTIAIDTYSYKIPEVRAGPIS